MSNIEDGGPAFPLYQPSDGQHAPFAVDGMSLRDWFAGQALAGICGDGIPGQHHAPQWTATDAYAYADAMITAREAK